ncbi:hypothetical protein TrRE_jg7200 [Triparma retinervis]|uniref:TauD/TfdA-like domain-containing protein n=1 Tax=Triparma retinervis TaxID=2557542 RepID=A0A9W7FIJ7_9STRA|nr:hypothetical protein TrRE_jg7200 [Triparma retinervis]
MKVYILGLFAAANAFHGPFVATPKPPLRTRLNVASLEQEVETPLAPLTAWGESFDAATLQARQRAKVEPNFPKVIDKLDLVIENELEWIGENSMSIKDDMVKYGAVVFRNFETMKEQPGFVDFYTKLGMNPCLDPLHSVSARPTIEGKGTAVYEAVNKESRKNFFIGMHNEFVGTRAPRAAAFVCFKAAEEGGEFLIANGRQIFKDLDSDLLERLYKRSIRYSVMELPFFAWVDKLPEFLQGGVMGAIKGAASAAINAKVDFSVELLEQVGGYDNTRLLQARAPSQPPVVLHPVSGEPTWFCNVHSHSSVLRKQRESLYGAEKFEDGASQINNYE